jgi:Carboxypeptidase regulatory-like domain
MWHRVALTMILLCAFNEAQTAAAQGAPTTSGVTRVINGIVRNASDKSVVSGATLEIYNTRFSRNARTDETGRFRFGQIPAGDYRLTVLRVGYAPFRQQVQVGEADAEVSIELISEAQRLNSIVTKANVTALYGGIGAVGPQKNERGEKTMTAVPGATIQILGARKEIKTDSLGLFFVELDKPGRYLVRVVSPGLSPELYTVDVPRNKAVDASRLLDSVRFAPPSGREILWREMDRRISMRTLTSALVSGAELRDKGGSMTDALQSAKAMTLRGMRIGAETCVFIDGLPKPNLALDGMRIEDVEAVELYGAKGDLTGLLASSWPSGAPCGRTNRYVPTENSAIPVAKYVVVWTSR